MKIYYNEFDNFREYSGNRVHKIYSKLAQVDPDHSIFADRF